MKRRLLVYVTLLVTGLALGRGPVAPEDPAGAGALACLDGDVNNDGRLDLGDPVHLLSYLFLGGEPPSHCTPAPRPVSIYVIVRHAEKETGTSDPGLTEEGRVRAQRLAEMLAPAGIQYLIASELRRTQETLEPLAELTGLAVEEVEGAPAVLARLAELPPGSLAVVAHHSYTIPDILKGLEIEGAADINVSGKHYDNFLIVLRPAEGKTRLLHLSY